MKDRHRLARIIRVKKRIRDAHRVELAMATRALAEAQNAMTEAASERSAAIVALTQPVERGAGDLALRAGIVAIAGETMASAQRLVADKRRMQLAKRESLDSAHRALRALEVLDDRLARQHARTRQQHDQMASDEAAARICRMR
ncbi:MAG: hypothetical protein MJD61_18475 [Proteobacteria bacterium]|nr:hypothetical protein [Pseudomonadota bacterium]